MLFGKICYANYFSFIELKNMGRAIEHEILLNHRIHKTAYIYIKNLDIGLAYKLIANRKSELWWHFYAIEPQHHYYAFYELSKPYRHLDDILDHIPQFLKDVWEYEIKVANYE